MILLASEAANAASLQREAGAAHESVPKVSARAVLRKIGLRLRVADAGSGARVNPGLLTGDAEIRARLPREHASAAGRRTVAFTQPGREIGDIIIEFLI